MNDSTDLPTVCLVTHPLRAAGENATRSLLEILSALTVVRLVTADLPADSVIHERHDVSEVSRRGASHSALAAALRFVVDQVRMCRAIGRRDDDIVLFFGATSYFLPMVYAQAIGRTVVVEPRGDVPLTLRLEWETRMPAVVANSLSGAVRLLERAGFRLADGIVTYTPGMAQQLDLDRYESNLHTEGARHVDIDRFYPDVPFSKRGTTVGFLGRIDEEKGVRMLANVAKLLPAEVTFRFIGDGALLPWLESYLADEIERGDVEVVGWVDHEDVPAELNRLRLLVMPSQPTEGLPTTILEAFACGTPVYANPVSGVPDVVLDEETGFLMRSSGPDGIAGDVVSILDRDDLASIGENGRKLVEDSYGFDAAVERYRRILTAVSGPAKRSSNPS